MMNVPDMEKPRITEIKVRMDCNGCVQKIKKALHGITGIYDLYIDFPQQKVTIIGWADVEKLVRAIKKTRKTAVICSHTEQPPPDQQASDPPPEGDNPPPPENSNAEPPPQTDAAPPPPPPEAQNGQPPPHQENPPPAESGNGPKDQPSPRPKPRDAEEMHVIHHHPPDYGYRYAYGHGHHNLRQGHGGHFDAPERVLNELPQGHNGHFSAYPGGSSFRGESSYQLPPSQTGYVTTHSYNTYKPSPYVTEYAYPRSPPPRYSHYSRPDHHHYINNNDYYYYSGNNGASGNGNITSMFSDENPNACTIA